jgi:hypothetical protein
MQQNINAIITDLQNKQEQLQNHITQTSATFLEQICIELQLYQGTLDAVQITQAFLEGAVLQSFNNANMPVIEQLKNNIDDKVSHLVQLLDADINDKKALLDLSMEHNGFNQYLQALNQHQGQIVQLNVRGGWNFRQFIETYIALNERMNNQNPEGNNLTQLQARLNNLYTIVNLTTELATNHQANNRTLVHQIENLIKNRVIELDQTLENSQGKILIGGIAQSYVSFRDALINHLANQQNQGRDRE